MSTKKKIALINPKREASFDEIHSWAVIENHYISLNRHGWGHEKLLELVKHIMARNTR